MSKGAKTNTAQSIQHDGKASNEAGVLRVAYDAEGKVSELSFNGVALPEDKRKRAHTHANTLLFIACRLGQLLAGYRKYPALQADHIILLVGPQAGRFWQIMKKKTDWFAALFGEAKPFAFASKKAELKWDIASSPSDGPGSAIKRVIVASPDAEHDSSSSDPILFERLNREFKARIADYAFAIAQSVTFGAEDFAEGLQQAHKKIARRDNLAFTEAYKHIELFKHASLRCFHMHLLSLIQPKDWFRDGHWETLYRHIHQLTLKSDDRPEHRVHRRLHILDKAITDEPESIIYLLDVMLCDLQHRLDSRCLLIDPSHVSYRANVPVYNDSLLINAGTFSMRGGHHAVILSTGRPYFENVSDGDFGVYPDLGKDTAATYYYLRHNFQHFYNPGGGRPHSEKLWRLPDVLKRAHEHLSAGRIESMPSNLRYFSGKLNDLEKSKAEIAEVIAAMTHADPDERELELATWFLKNRPPVQH